ncbi:hypothetical protein KI387_003520, partial [Taxus chinensis]
TQPEGKLLSIREYLPGYSITDECISLSECSSIHGIDKGTDQDKGRPLPKFGEWDVNDPASAEGFTVIFNKARDEKKTGGNTRIPGAPADSPAKDDDVYKHHGDQNKSATVGLAEDGFTFCFLGRCCNVGKTSFDMYILLRDAFYNGSKGWDVMVWP